MDNNLSEKDQELDEELDNEDILDKLEYCNNYERLSAHSWYSYNIYPIGYDSRGKPSDVDDIFDGNFFQEVMNSSNLIDHLQNQLVMGFDDNEINYANNIINNLDSDGFLRIPLEETLPYDCRLEYFSSDSCKALVVILYRVFIKACFHDLKTRCRSKPLCVLPTYTTQQSAAGNANRHSRYNSQVPVFIGWGARDRTWECRNQNPVPYRLATPQ